MIAIQTYDRDGNELIDLYESEKVYYGKNAEPCGGIMVVMNQNGVPDRDAIRTVSKTVADAINKAHVEMKTS